MSAILSIESHPEHGMCIRGQDANGNPVNLPIGWGEALDLVSQIENYWIRQRNFIDYRAPFDNQRGQEGVS